MPSYPLEPITETKSDCEIDWIRAMICQSQIDCDKHSMSTGWRPHNWVNASNYVMRWTNSAAIVEDLCKSAHEYKHEELVAALQEVEDCQD